MKKLSKKQLRTAYGEADLPEHFSEEIGIAAEKVFCMPTEKLPDLQKDFGLFNFQHVDIQLGEKTTTAKVGVTEEFAQMMSKRKSMWVVLKSIYENIDSSMKSTMGVCFGLILFFGFFSIWAHSQKEKNTKKNEQLKVAQQLLLSGNWKNNPKPAGPLDIDIAKYFHWKNAINYNDSINNQISSASYKIDSLNKIYTYVDDSIVSLQQKVEYGKIDSLNKIYKKKLASLVSRHLQSKVEQDSAVTILLESEKEIKSIKATAYEERKSYLQESKKTLGQLLQIQQQKIDSLQKRSIPLPSEPSVVHLEDPNFYDWARVVYKTSMVLLYILVIILVICLMIVVIHNLEDIAQARSKQNNSSNHTPMSLRMLAFFRRNSAMGAHTTTIEIRNLDELDRDLIALCIVRKKCNVLMAASSFEFIENINENEKQPNEEDVIPIFYIAENNVVVLYTGLIP